jgi:Uma2 family endonuclease
MPASSKEEPMVSDAMKLMTAEEFYDWANHPDNAGRLYELERGRVVEVSRPGVRHGRVCITTAFVLEAYVRQVRQGYVLGNDTGVIWARSPDTVRGPDLMLYSDSRPYDQLNIKYSEQLPTLLVEVLSPSDKYFKVVRRVNEFLDRGVPVIWVIDPEDRVVGVYRPGQLPVILDETDEIDGGAELPGFRCRVADLFFTPT